MSRLTDLYKRVMYGQAGMYGNHAEKSGLFGTGGEKTGGLIDFNKMNNQPGGLLQNIPKKIEKFLKELMVLIIMKIQKKEYYLML
jgi:hypothetical protein